MKAMKPRRFLTQDPFAFQLHPAHPVHRELNEWRKRAVAA